MWPDGRKSFLSFRLLPQNANIKITTKGDCTSYFAQA